MKAHPADAVAFLKKLRPGGPWVLTAIIPDGSTTTITARTAREVEAFIRKHDGAQNLYYSVNPTRSAMHKKAAKTDIAAIEYAIADLDPAAGESSDAAKARYLNGLNGAFSPKASGLIDSGNGIQCLWKLDQCIELGEPIKTKDGDGNTVLVFSPEDQAKIDDVEGRVAAIMRRLGSKAGTQNIDRILRLPGTVNLPNKKKRDENRGPCLTKLLCFDDVAHPLTDFPPPDEETAAKTDKETEEDDAGIDVDYLNAVIRNGCYEDFKDDRSNAVWFVVNEMLRRGYLRETIIKVLLDRDYAISEHIYAQAKPRKYAERQIVEAIKKIKFVRNKEKRIIGNQVNIRIALLKLGVTLRYDQFADRILIDGLPEFGPVLDDAAVNRLWLLFDQQFDFIPARELMFTVLHDTARRNSFHPVICYLDCLQWDGVPRVDTWLIDHAGAQDDEYVRAVSALMLIAAVRRVREPGCKFDEMLVLEQPLQGTDKSTALSVMAVQDDWFSDDLPLNAEGKRVIEMIRGRWIIEAAELSGMKKADVEHLKAMLSRRIDRARPAYGRLPIEAPRQCVIVGTTNKNEYLRDTSGNRRFWPVLVTRFDLAALRRNRDQLWAEAAAREAGGESIRLARELWPLAAEEQKQRLADDPYVAVLAKELGDRTGKIRAADVWVILDLHGASLTQEQYIRAAEAMKRIGFERPNKSGMLRFHGGPPQTAYVRGKNQKQRAQEIQVSRTRDGLCIVTIEPRE